MSIELPVDANGMTVPLDTSVMYRDDNSRFPVTDFFYEAKTQQVVRTQWKHMHRNQQTASPNKEEELL